MRNELNGVNETGLESGFGIVTLDGTLESRVAAIKNKINEGVVVGMANKVNANVGDVQIKGGTPSNAPIVIRVGDFGGLPTLPTMPAMPTLNNPVARMDATLVNSAIDAGVFGKRSTKDLAIEELRNARWYQKHVTSAWIPGSTEKNPLTADLSMVNDEQSNDALNMFSVVIDGEIVPAIVLMPATFKRHLEGGHKIVLKTMHTFKGARYYPIDYTLDEGTETLHSVSVKGITHPVKNENGTNKLGADGKPVFEFNDGLNIQISAQLHAAGHKLVAAFIEWAKSVGYNY